MNQRKYRSLLMSMALTLLVGLAMPGLADDTEVYLQQVDEVNEFTRPNLLFMLDNSGSMTKSLREDDGTPLEQSRIDVLKEALLTMLDSAHNINVGLARFAYKKTIPDVNAPIMFPVAHIDQETNTIRGEEDDTIVEVSSSIGHTEDDAEENVNSGEIRLSDKTLEMITITPDDHPGIREDKQIGSNQDDAVEWLEDNNNFSNNKSIHYLGTHPKKGKTLIGLRFQELGIPKNATIEYAELEFQCPYQNDIDRDITPEQVCGNAPLNLNNDVSSGGEAFKIEVSVAALRKPNQDATQVSFGHQNFKVDGLTVGYLTHNFYDHDRIIDPVTQEPFFVKTPELEPLEDDTGNVQPGRKFKIGGLQELVQAVVNQERIVNNDTGEIEQEAWHHSKSIVLLLKLAKNSSQLARGFYTSDGYNKGSGEVPILRVYWSQDKSEKTYLSGWDDNAEPLKRLENSHHMAESTKKSMNEIRLGREILKQGSSPETKVGLLFSALDIPPGAEITEAKVILTQQAEREDHSSTVGQNAPLTLEICGEKIPNADTFNKADPNRSVGNRYTRATENCGVKKISSSSGAGTKIEIDTEVIKPILEEIIAQPDWKVGNNMVLLFKRQGTSTSGFRRIVSAGDIKTSKTEPYSLRSYATLPNLGDTNEELVQNFKEYLPKLEVTFSAGKENDDKVGEDRQIIGLRFEGVDIPQGAEVVSANIEFVSGADASSSTSLKIQVEEVDDAQPFTEEINNVSDRMETTNSQVSWRLITPWQEGLKYTTPELKELVQKVVNRSEWCGGRGGLTFIISAESGANPLRNAKSYDNRPNFAPRLNVEYDSKKISGSGCVNQNWSGQVSATYDDAEEKTGSDDTGYVFTPSNKLELGVPSNNDNRLVGFRFNDLPISSGATIVKANLIVTSQQSGKDKPGTLTILGEKSPNAKAFTKDKYNLSQRTKTSASVSWTPEDTWKINMLYQSEDIKAVIQEIIAQPEWQTYNSLALFVKGNGRFDVFSYDGKPIYSAILRIQVEGKLGEDGQGNLMTVRRRLTKIVKKMEIPQSQTPIVDALFESSRYYLGKPVDYGKSRHHELEYLVSHPGTYTGGTIKGVGEDCNVNRDPFNVACTHEEISGNPVYESPIESVCQTNHIILLTDGIATKLTAIEPNHNIQALIRELGGEDECIKEYQDPNPNDPLLDNPSGAIKVSKHETCGIDLADALINSGDSTRKGITVHTIGFQLGKGWDNVYETTSGERKGERVYNEDKAFYYEKDNKEVAKDVDVEKVGYKENPKLTNTNKKTVKYLCRMASKRQGGSSSDAGHPCPDRSFYPATTAEDLLRAFQDIFVEALTMTTFFAAPGISINRFNNLYHDDKVYFALFKSSINQRWDGNVKKYRLIGGELYGEDDSLPIADAKGNIRDQVQSLWSDEVDGNDVTKGGAGGETGYTRNVLTYLDKVGPGRDHAIPLMDYKIDALAADEQNSVLATALLGEEAEQMPAEEKETLLNNVIQWIIGGERWMFADPLHSSPKVITYGGDSEEPESTVFVGTNDGLIRAINAKDGEEKWAFLPQEMLSKQVDMMENGATGQRLYGIDGTPVFWLNGNGIKVNPDRGDFVKLFMGMRRGGRNVYALNVTDVDSQPKLMWTIKGGDSPYERLGQTWSDPKVVKVNPYYCTNAEVPSGTVCMALLFGGGHDPNQDEIINQNATMGNAIYMVYANTGDLLWWASDEQSGANLGLNGMDYPVPSELTTQDYDNDGYTDRVYFGDLGGQVWRIDLDPNVEDNKGGRGGRLLKASTSTSIDISLTSQRTFFYSPAVAKLEGTDITVVAIVSGSRPHPLYDGLNARDQFYVFIDPVDETGSNWDDFYDGDAILDHDDLTDVSDISVTESVNLGQNDDEHQQSTPGWYLSFCEKAEDEGCEGDSEWLGEKGFSPTYVASDIAYFSTYIPPQKEKDNCSQIDVGKGRLYAIDLRTGGVPEGEEEEGRVKAESPGTPNLSPPIYTPDGTIILFNLHSEKIRDPKLKRTFWTQIE